MPVFNRQAFIQATLESILGQSYGQFELLAIDDGSDDRTPEILRAYADRDSRVRVLRHENKGVGYTIGRGISEARGRLIAEIGADDIALPGRLEKQVAFLDKNEEHVMVGSYLELIDDDGRVIGVRRYPTTDRNIRTWILVYNPFASPSLMYRRSDALAAGGYTSRFRTCEDYDFVLRMAKRGKVANIAEVLTSYRLHASSIKSERTREQLHDTMRIRKIARLEYGYSKNPGGWLVDAALRVLLTLPPKVAYGLFKRLFIRAVKR